MTALRTPSLWRRIALVPEEQMCRERIYRAKACSLDVQLLPWRATRSRGIAPQRLDAHTVQLRMHLVLPYIHRWRSLEIVLPDHEPFLANAALSGCCVSHKRGRAPLLEELTLVYRNNDDSKEFCLFSGCTPHLRRLTLDGLRLAWLPSLFGRLVFLDYTHHAFSEGDDAVAELLAMLGVCAALRELRVLFPRRSPLAFVQPFRARLGRVALLRLVCLHLRVETRDIPPELTRLVTHLSTPSLTSLHLTDIGHRRHTFPSLVHFMQSYPKLPSLQTVFVEYGWHGSFLGRRVTGR